MTIALNLARRPDWDRHLMEWLRTVMGAEWVWGKTDCTCLAIGAIAAITGTPAPAIRAAAEIPAYATKRGALRAWRLTGGTSAVLARLGFVEVAPAFAWRGDILVAGADPLDSAFVVHEMGRVLGIGEGGTVQWYRLDSLPGATAYRLPAEVA